MYFIGKGLADNNDPRATRYFLNAIYLTPFLFRAWWWAALSLVRRCSNRLLPGEKCSGPSAVSHDR
jgi:hypothetical protein